MTELDVNTHKETIRWFIDNPKKGVWTRREADKKWRLTSSPSFDSTEIFVIADEFQDLRKAQKDGEDIQCCIDFDHPFPPCKGAWFDISEIPAKPIGGVSYYRVKEESGTAELNPLP